MAEMIQFPCPVCGTALRLPLAMAAVRGPCPNCSQEIIAPDPARGLAAHKVPVPEPPVEIEPVGPDGPPTPVPQLLSEPPPEPQPPVARPSRGRLALSCLLTGLLTLAIGFFLGMRVGRESSPPPAPAVPLAAEVPAVPKPPLPEPVTIRVKPIIDPVPAEMPEPEPREEPKQVSATAEATLRAFLEAPDWASRSAYVLFPEKIRAAMEAYSQQAPDGPTAFKAITPKQTQLDEATGYTLMIFFVATEAFPTGIPTAVQETADGWRVDWQAFVEFRDQLFQKFVEGPIGRTGRFHLIVSQPPPAAEVNRANEHFMSVVVNAPLNPTQQAAYVKKASEASATLRAATPADEFFTPVLEIAKRGTPDGKTYLEILEVVASNWSPREP
jgi:hypothetical protein